MYRLEGHSVTIRAREGRVLPRRLRSRRASPPRARPAMAFGPGGALYVTKESGRGRAHPARRDVRRSGEYLARTHGRKLTRVVLGRGKRAALSTFATGFVHPLAVAVDARSGLLVADHGRGVVYRIQQEGRP